MRSLSQKTHFQLDSVVLQRSKHVKVKESDNLQREKLNANLSFGELDNIFAEVVKVVKRQLCKGDFRVDFLLQIATESAGIMNGRSIPSYSLPAWIRVVYAVFLAGAALSHVLITFHHGLGYDYGGVPLASAYFWTSLTFLDPLAVLMLLTAPRAGVALTIAIIVTDVVHNTWLGSALGADYLAQAGFLLFVLATAHIAWRMPNRPTA